MLGGERDRMGDRRDRKSTGTALGVEAAIAVVIGGAGSIVPRGIPAMFVSRHGSAMGKG